MSSSQDFSRLSFVKSYLFPAFIVFLIPGFSFWFFGHAEARFDREILASIESQSQLAPTPDAERRKVLEFYRSTPISRVLASNDPQVLDVQAQFDTVAIDYGVFRWMKRIALACLVTAVVAVFAVGIGVAFSFHSQATLYWNLKLGWYVLRIFAMIQVLGQGALAVALSYWMTVLWMNRYYPKLIAAIAILAIVTVGMLLKAVFSRLSRHGSVVGRVLEESEAPSFWQRVRELTERVHTASPDQIIVGIDDNFFVTEQPVMLGDELRTGRTLFVSLSLLRVLTRGEADAVLGHEMAHFSGEDTLYSVRISPLLERYGLYLRALHDGVISQPVFQFMVAFWSLYQLALRKISREREFRADRIGAELSSSKSMAGALVKITAYARYREKVQVELFSKDEIVHEMDVSKRIESGFPTYLRACLAGEELAESGTPHPFDTHPSTARRLASLGVDPDAALRDESLLDEVADSWFSSIESAAAIEGEQWRAFEQAFHTIHERELAWRFLPAGAEETAHVVKFFPEVRFDGKKGAYATMDFEKLQVSDWDAPIRFAAIDNCLAQDGGLGKYVLTVGYRVEGEKKLRQRKFCPSDYKGEGRDLYAAFQEYYARHKAAEQHALELRWNRLRVEPS